MTQQLLLITKNYPYNTGEEFLEAEIAYLADAFEKVVIVAAEVDEKGELTRELPSTVQAFTGNPLNSAYYGMALATGIEAKLLKPLLTGYDKARRKASLERRLYFRYFAQKTANTHDVIQKLFERGVLSPDEPLTLYSYLLHDTAVAALLLRTLLQREHIPVIARAHRLDLYEEQHPAQYLPLMPWILENIDAVYPASFDGSAYLNQKFPGFDAKIQTAYLGTPDAGLNPFAVTGQGQRALNIVSVAPLKPKKQLGRIIEALALLEQGTELPLNWTHFGAGDEEAALRALAAQRLSRSTWSFEGHATTAVLLGFYRQKQVDVFLSASLAEGLPFSMMQALSFGIPVVAVDAGAVREIVKDGVSGMLLPAQSTAHDIAQGLLSLINGGAGAYLALRQGARSLWKQSFDAARNYPAFIEELLSRSQQEY
ncbi:MAG: glycosyltransferase [Coriobacteriales bacterium]|jgi:glycosyltransferase involved in cell wall biosynthesis|nr:glycosyltransferase [Coriobacteriales bacterium]